MIGLLSKISYIKSSSIKIFYFHSTCCKMESNLTWKKPEVKSNSYITGLKVNNTLAPGNLVEFVPKNGRQVTWYMCGPTVYDASHLGHARTYLGFDMIRRVMKYYFNYDVLLCMNITNIDDKIILRSNEAKEEFTAFATKWENDFFDDMKKLNVELPDVITRVSEYVEEIVDFIKGIIDRGYAYESNGSVYFDVPKYRKDTNRYGKLKDLGDEKDVLKELKEGDGALTKENEKRSAFDFCLWKASKPGEPKWNSPWGEGRPGWHIECSAMANSILGNPPLDIHSGGIDLRFPHHENEIAQSEAFYNSEQWINYFIHTGHLNINGMKMAKTLKNFITIKSMVSRYSARQIRLLFLTHKYDSVMDYQPSVEEVGPEFLEKHPEFIKATPSMKEIGDVDKKFSEFFLNCKAALRENPITKSQKWNKAENELNVFFIEKKQTIHEHFLNNFNTPEVLREIDQLMSAVNKYRNTNTPLYPLVYSIVTYISFIFKTMGVIYDDKLSSSANSEESKVNVEDIATPYIETLSKFRDEVRGSAKNNKPDEILKSCDILRDDILPYLGVRLEDKAPGTPASWKFDDKDKLIEEKQKKAEEKAQKELEKLKRAEEAARKAAELEAKSKIPPNELFIGQTDLYSQFDENGIPTHDNEGKELSGGKKKALKKEHEKQEKLYKAWLEKSQEKKE